jgi:hypothetical protein
MNIGLVSAFDYQGVPPRLGTFGFNLNNSDVIERLGWRRYNFSSADFSTAANTNSITLFSLPANTILEKMIIKHTTAFTGGSLTAYTVQAGITGNLNKYADPFDVFQAVAESAQQTSTIDAVENFDTATTVLITATSTGDTLDNAAAGELYVLVKLGAIQ